MTITTYTTYVTNLSLLTITGVTRAYLEPPRQISTADLPISYVRLPRGGENPLTGDATGGWPTLNADLVIVLEPYRQSTQAANYTLALTMLDNVSTALRASTNLGRAAARWTIRQDIEQYGDASYWVIIASVESNG